MCGLRWLRGSCGLAARSWRRCSTAATGGRSGAGRGVGGEADGEGDAVGLEGLFPGRLERFPGRLERFPGRLERFPGRAVPRAARTVPRAAGSRASCSRRGFRGGCVLSRLPDRPRSTGRWRSASPIRPRFGSCRASTTTATRDNHPAALLRRERVAFTWVCCYSCERCALPNRQTPGRFTRWI